MGAPAPVARDLSHARHRRRGRLVLPPARAERGPGLYREDHGGAGVLAGSHPRRHARAGHRPHRKQAAGDAEPRLPEELHERGPDDDLRQPEGFHAPVAGAGHLVSGAQESPRHRQHAAARHRRPRLQRRVRRYLRHRLRLHRGRLHGPGAARLRRRCPQAASAASGHLQDRHPRRAGRARLRRILGEAAGGPRDRPLRARSPRCRRRTPSPPRASCRPGTRRSSSASRARSGPSRMCSPSTSSRRTAGSSASATSRMSPAAPPTRRSRCSASTDVRASGSRSPCARAATCWRWGAMSSTPWPRSRRTCRSGSSRRSSPTSP